jgi:hypothetical protein
MTLTKGATDGATAGHLADLQRNLNAAYVERY